MCSFLRFVGKHAPCLLLLAVAGCGAATGAVSGKVTFDGAPLPDGQIRFFPEDGRMIVAAVTDGAYTAPKVPIGPVKVAVLTFEPGFTMKKRTAPLPAHPTPDPRYVPLPKAYGDPETSGLTTTVAAGEQTYDVDLKKK